MQIVHRILEIIGGATIVIGGISLFFSNLIRDFLKQRWKNAGDIETDKEKAFNAIERIQPEQYTRHQYEVCVELWNALADVRSATDALWESATEENIVSLNKQLRTIQTKIYSWNLFFAATGRATRTGHPHSWKF